MPVGPNTEAKERVLAILGFHKIGRPTREDWDTWFYVSEERFCEYLRCLRDDGWTVIDVRTFLAGLDAPEALPEKSVLLTFDDGYKTMRSVTLPLLSQFGYPAILFVPSDFIGTFNTFDEGVEPKEAICDWDDLRDLERNGVSIQSHSVSHRALSTLTPGELEEEATRSKATLEAGLGGSVDVFSYPYGDGGLDHRFVRETMKGAGYRAACLYGGGPNIVPTAEPYRLTRLPIGPDTDLRTALAGR